MAQAAETATANKQRRPQQRAAEGKGPAMAPEQLRQAYQQETVAQEERVKTEQARATADQQRDLVRAQIAVQVSERAMAERQNLGEAERRYLEALARGQEAQAGVLGPGNALLLQALQQVLATLREKPELVGMDHRQLTVRLPA